MYVVFRYDDETGRFVPAKDTLGRTVAAEDYGLAADRAMEWTTDTGEMTKVQYSAKRARKGKREY